MSTGQARVVTFGPPGAPAMGIVDDPQAYIVPEAVGDRAEFPPCTPASGHSGATAEQLTFYSQLFLTSSQATILVHGLDVVLCLRRPWERCFEQGGA